MKDIIITSKKVKRELYILLGCFVVAVLINISAIVYYNTFWRELITQIGYEIVIAVSLYLVILIIRLVFKLMLLLFKKTSKR